MRTGFLAAIVVVGILSSGCAGTGEPETTASPSPPVGASHDDIFARVAEAIEGVPCNVPSVTNTATSANLKQIQMVKWDGGGSAEIDIKNNLLLAARGRGLSTVDITDPLNPVILGNYTEAGGNLDVKFSPDNLTALVGVGNGIDLVDIRDPSEPTSVGKWGFPTSYPGGMPVQNAHMLNTALINGIQWVFLAPNTNTGVWVLKLEGPPEARKLTFVTTTLPAQGGPLGPHDMVAQFDEDLKKWVLYSADGYHGWSVWDLSDPAKPALIGGIVRPETGYLHTIQAAKIGQRRIVATIAEVGANFVQVYDATNIRAPILLATWQVGDVVSAEHNLNIVQGKLFVAHYAQGIFVFDLNELPATPSPTLVTYKPIAHYAGVQGSSFWDVLVKDGVVYASDIPKGVHVVGYGCFVPGNTAATSIN